MTETTPGTTARPRQAARRSANMVATPAPPVPPPQAPTAATPKVNNWDAIRKVLNDKKAAIAKVIPAGIATTADSIMQNAIQQIETSREASKLKLCRPSSVLYAVIAAAGAGLDFINDYAFLVPFERTTMNQGARVFECWEAKLIPGYKGLLNVAARHGYLLDVQAVYPNETCHIRLGTDNTIEHEAGFDTNQHLVGVYCVVRDKETDRVQHIERMSKADIDHIAATATAKAWKDASRYPEMAKKTVARRGFKWLPKDASEIRILNEVERRNDTGEPLTDLATKMVENGGSPAAKQ
jgi:phage RecT family recombinase